MYQKVWGKTCNISPKEKLLSLSFLPSFLPLLVRIMSERIDPTDTCMHKLDEVDDNGTR